MLSQVGLAWLYILVTGESKRHIFLENMGKMDNM
jgi:hypothetical protein